MKLWADNVIFSPRKSDNYVSPIELACCIHLINVLWICVLMLYSANFVVNITLLVAMCGMLLCNDDTLI